jgi:membrane-associated phospholipid phosphatase
VNSTELRRIDCVIWITIAVVGGAVIATTAVSTFMVVWSSVVDAVLVCSGLVFASLFYRHIRKEQPLAEALCGASQVIAFATVAAPLSYIAASAAFPLWDAQLAVWDRQLGFDWMAWLALMNAAPFLHLIAKIAYSSFAFQTTLVVMALGFARRSLHMRLFVLALCATTLVTIGISTLLPAQGVWGAWHLSLADSPMIVPTTRDLPLPVFFGLRDGTYRQLVVDNAEGIISFPSLHAALGALFVFALWPLKRLRWIALLINLVMVAATPVEGSHYFMDVAAGLLIATLCWFAVSGLLRRATHIPVTNGAIHEDSGPRQIAARSQLSRIAQG